MLEDYKRLVDIIKSDKYEESKQEEALKALLRLYSHHLKQDENEALKYTKSAVLCLFKKGCLRGLTENLKGLKPTYIKIMDLIKPGDMEFFKFTETDKECFITLREKLDKEIAFILDTNDSGKFSSHEKVNQICSEGIDDDDIYSLK